MEPEPPLEEADDLDEVRDTSYRLDVSATRSLDEDALPAVKCSRSTIMKCSLSTISEGNGREIIGRL